jgi:branched-chain amino acid transport system permease protein
VIAFVSFLLLPFIPLFVTNPFLIRVLCFVFMYSIYAASWDTLAGFTGQFNLGQALFFGVAAYTAALLNTHLDFSPWATIPLGAIAGILAGLLIGVPALRLRGIYFALASLAYPIILVSLVFAFSEFTGGEEGISGVSSLSHSPITTYYILMLSMMACVLAMWKLTDSGSHYVRTGLIFNAIREDEITARSSGIDTTRNKLVAFSISGFFAGIAGGFYAHIMRISDPSTLALFTSFMPIVWTVFGGMGTIYGPVTGVFILYPITQVLPFSSELRTLIMVLLILPILFFMPEGLAVWVRDHLEQVCPRCKNINFIRRQRCRICNAPLHLERE